jgi:hypothetical protein
MTTSTKELIERLEHDAKALRGAMPHDANEWADNCEAVAQRLRELDKPECIWTNGEADEVFETQCGNTFTFIDGGIKENDCKFCQYCGGAVKSEGLANE